MSATDVKTLTDQIEKLWADDAEARSREDKERNAIKDPADRSGHFKACQQRAEGVIREIEALEARLKETEHETTEAKSALKADIAEKVSAALGKKKP